MDSDHQAHSRFTELLAVLEREYDGSEAPPSRMAELIEAGRALSLAYEVLEARLEASEERAVAQRAMLETIGCPLLQVGADVLCMPIVGGLDASRAAKICDELLFGAAARGVRAVIIDVTGAMIYDQSTVATLVQLLRGLSLLGVRGVLSGIQPDMARLLVEFHDLSSGLTCYRNLEAALAALRGSAPRNTGGGA